MPIITQTWTEQSTVPKFRERNSNVLKLIAAEKIKQVFIVDIASETCNVSLQQHCPLEFKNWTFADVLLLKTLEIWINTSF